MPDIQVDMFEVQLGAAIFLQFRTEDGGLVRILADAGIKAGGYPRDHILKKLLPLLGSERRIDLIIGTHYDEDHLNGLVPIIEQQDIEIGEAWMPPVANDSSPPALDAMLTEGDLLAHQFRSEGGAGHLAKYLRAKRADVEALRALESRSDGKEGLTLSRIRLNILGQTDREGPGDLSFFRQQLSRSEHEDACNHAIDQEVEDTPEVENAIANARRLPSLGAWYGPEIVGNHFHIARSLAEIVPDAATAQLRSLGNIRQSAAKDAINASALFDVIQALKARNIPIRTEIIRDGEPRRYAWDPKGRRFQARPSGGGHPILTLLGPSAGLVRKHWKRLPVEQAATVALSFLTEIKSITPSNQLSYIARLEQQGQGILVTGDAGCVDFKPSRGKYFPKLLDALLPLHIVQIAHHGGNNAHFYRVLEEAGYPAQTEPSLLLLSHATQDKFRPSPEFRAFILGTLKLGDDVQLLFTSRPRVDLSRDFQHAFHAVVGQSADVGDVQMVWDQGKWHVTQHAVSP